MGVIFHADPVHGESHIQPKANREVATVAYPRSLKSSRDSSMVLSNRSLLLPQEQAGFDTEGRPTTRSPCWHRRSKIAFRLRRRPELCLSISQQPATQYDIVVSPASCCNCYMIDTWSAWSWAQFGRGHGRRVPQFFRWGNIICYVPLLFLFRFCIIVPKIKLTFATFCVKCFPC